MAVLDKEKFMSRIREYFGESPDDNNLSFMEDIIDSYNDVEARSNDGDWQTRYNQLDEQWRKRYTDRFFSPVPDSATGNEAYLTQRTNEDVTIETNSPDDTTMGYGDLFN